MSKETASINQVSVADLKKSTITRLAILDAGRIFLRSRPFREMSVGNLMAGTGYSRPTFYQHFEDVHALMAALLDEIKAAIEVGASAWIAGEGDPVETLRDSLAALVDVCHRDGEIFKAIADASTQDGELEVVWTQFLQEFDQIVATKIADEQAKGLTPKFDPIPVAQALNRMDAFMFVSSFGAEPKAHKAEVLAALEHIWLAAVYPHSFPVGELENP